MFAYYLTGFSCFFQQVSHGKSGIAVFNEARSLLYLETQISERIRDRVNIGEKI